MNNGHTLDCPCPECSAKFRAPTMVRVVLSIPSVTYVYFDVPKDALASLETQEGLNTLVGAPEEIGAVLVQEIPEQNENAEWSLSEIGTA